MQGVAGDDERRMTIVQHLEELRRVLIWVMAAWIVGTAVAFVFNGFFIGVLLHPLSTGPEELAQHHPPQRGHLSRAPPRASPSP